MTLVEAIQREILTILSCRPGWRRAVTEQESVDWLDRLLLMPITADLILRLVKPAWFQQWHDQSVLPAVNDLAGENLAPIRSAIANSISPCEFFVCQAVIHYDAGWLGRGLVKRMQRTGDAECWLNLNSTDSKDRKILKQYMSPDAPCRPGIIRTTRTVAKSRPLRRLFIREQEE